MLLSDIMELEEGYDGLPNPPKRVDEAIRCPECGSDPIRDNDGVYTVTASAKGAIEWFIPFRIMN